MVVYFYSMFTFQGLSFQPNQEMDDSKKVNKTGSNDKSVTSNTKMKEMQNNKPKSYICDICGQTCACNSHLIIHKRKHSGEKPFSCDICDKSFTIMSTLRKHKLIHTSEKCLTCKICNKTFSRRNIFLSHIRTHSDE